MNFIDIGINIINKQFQYDTEAVIKRAELAGVSPMILTGTSLHVSQKSAQC